MINPSNYSDIITTIINQYVGIFSSYFNQFLDWGVWIFYSFSTIGIVWLCLWSAFEKHSITAAMPGFLKEFFLIAFFYTLMTHAASWLSSIVDTTQTMGLQLTHQVIDPASIIQQGLTIANRILAPIKNSAAANLGIGASLIIAAYLITLSAFIAVAINLAVTLLMTTFFVSLSGLTLAFGGFALTRAIALRTLDTIIAFSFKLLCLYLVINAGAGIFSALAASLPLDKILTFDIYAWTSAAALLFWMAAHHLPKQAVRLFAGAFEQNRSDNVTLEPATMPLPYSQINPPASSFATSLYVPDDNHVFPSKPRGNRENI